MSSIKSNINSTFSESELDIDLNKDINRLLEKSDKDLSTVESNNVKEYSKSTPKKQSVTPTNIIKESASKRTRNK